MAAALAMSHTVTTAAAVHSSVGVRRRHTLGARRTIPTQMAKASPSALTRGVTLTVRAAEGGGGAGEGEGAAASQSQPSTPSPPSPPEDDAGGNGKTLAGAGFAVGIALFAATTLGGAPTLASLEKDAVPLDVALNNGRPTVVEFYADW